MPADLAIRRLGARIPARAQPVAARLALQALGADLADALPRGLPPQSLLWLRRLQLQAPEALLSRPVPAGWRQGWIASGREHFDAALAQAARPALGPVADSAPAVLFADAAEMLACLALAAQAGALDRWWWRGLLGRSWPQWQAAWAARPEAQAGAVRLLVRMAQGGEAWALAAARAVVDSGFAVPSVPGAAAAWLGRAGVSAVEDVAMAAQRRAGSAPAASHREPALAATPDPSAVPIQPAPPMPQRVANVLMQRTPSTPAAPLKPQADGTRAAMPAARHQAALAARVLPTPSTTAPGQRARLNDEPPAAEALARPALTASASERHPPVAAAQLPSRDFPASAPVEHGTRPAMPPAEPAAQPHGLTPRVAAPPAAALAQPPGSAHAEPPGRAATARLPPAPTAAPRIDAAPSAWPLPQALLTRQAPLLFLVNALLEDGLYPDFTQPRDPGLPVPLWALLPALAHAWRLPVDDALHAAMAERCAPWTAPAAMPAAPGTAAGPWSVWLSSYARMLRRRLCRRLGLRASAWPRALVLHRPARLWLSEAEWVAEFELPAHDVAWRLAGLDRDPGWLPSAGCSLRFRFIC